MKLPDDTLPIISTVSLPNGVTQYVVSLTFNGATHDYTCYELSDFAGMNIMMQAAADGYGQTWTEVVPDLPFGSLPPEPVIDPPAAVDPPPVVQDPIPLDVLPPDVVQ